MQYSRQTTRNRVFLPRLVPPPMIAVRPRSNLPRSLHTPHKPMSAENTCAVNFKVGMASYGPAGCNEAGLCGKVLIFTAVIVSNPNDSFVLNFACVFTFFRAYTLALYFKPRWICSGQCQDFCSKSPATWSNKCLWKKCKACSQCR